MIDELKQAFQQSIRMLEDGIGKIPDSCWWEGSGEYLVPVRLAYHTLVGLEWFVSTLLPKEHLQMRRFKSSDNAPLDELPDRQALLDDLVWIAVQIEEWFTDWTQEAISGKDGTFRLKKACYFLRHTQHHIGELSATARILQLDRPTWEFLRVKDLTVILDADGPAANVGKG